MKKQICLIIFLVFFVIATAYWVAAEDNYICDNEECYYHGTFGIIFSSANCGNGVIETGEQCDGQNLGGQTCASRLGSSYSGSLSCQANCVFDTFGCNIVQPPVPNTPSGTGSTPRGGGSSSSSRRGSISCVENWQCSGWNICTGGKQTRTCIDDNNCGTLSIKPSLERACTEEGSSGDAGISLNKASSTGLAGITGAIIGALGTGGTIAVVVVVIAGIIGTAVSLSVRRFRKK